MLERSNPTYANNMTKKSVMVLTFCASLAAATLFASAQTATPSPTATNVPRGQLRIIPGAPRAINVIPGRGVGGEMRRDARGRRTDAAAARVADGIDLTCIQTAVGKRDDAIIAAHGVFAAAIKQALTTRRDALKAAWGLTDRAARRKAIQEAWRAYESAAKAARKTLHDAVKATWKQSEIDRRACVKSGSPNAPASDDATNQGIDISTL